MTLIVRIYTDILFTIIIKEFRVKKSMRLPGDFLFPVCYSNKGIVSLLNNQKLCYEIKIQRNYQ